MTVHGLEAGIVTHDGEHLSRFYERGLGFTLDRILEFPQGTVQRPTTVRRCSRSSSRPRHDADGNGWSSTRISICRSTSPTSATVQQAIDAGASVLNSR